jgi:hypothetical protein
MMASISATISRVRFGETPSSLAVSSTVGMRPVSTTLRGMTPRYPAERTLPMSKDGYIVLTLVGFSAA